MRKTLLTLKLKRALLGVFFIGSLNCATAQVSVVATAGVPAGSYTTLKGAFDAINAGTHQGDIAIGISANTTETAPAVLNSSGAGAATYTNLVISPTADGVSISGATTTGRGLIELNGADNVVINGDNPNTGGTNRNLTIQNTAANTVTYTSVIRVALSTLITTGNNNSVLNCIIIGSATGRNIAAATSTTGSEHTTYGVLVGGAASTVAVTTAPSALTSVTTTLASPITALNFIASNNSIDACARGISINGGAVTVATPLTLTNNVIGSATAGNTTTVYSRGISIQGYNNALISNNTIRNMEWFVGTAQMAIGLGDVTANGTNAIVDKNIVNRVFNASPSTFGAYGINIAGGTNHIIRTNSITDIHQDMTGGGAFSTTFGVFGIRIGGGTGHQVYHNSVNLSGLRPGTANSSLLSAACAVVGTGQTGCDIRNNIFTNTMTGGTTSLASVSLYLPSAGTSAMNLNLNNNAYYCGATAASQGILQVSATSSVANLYLPANFIAGAVAPATNSRSYTSTLSVAANNDNASYASSNAAPYTSSTDLHLNLASSELTNVEQKGVAGLVGVATDFDGQSRPDGATLLPDMGFDEVTNASCSGTPTAGIISGVAALCSGNSTTLTLTGSSTGAGITYQWASSTTPGGPYTNLLGTASTQATGALTTTTYYVVGVGCTASGLSSVTAQFTVVVNANPVVTTTPSSASYCNPGTAVSLTASGALNYAWSPASGLSTTIGATVLASPTSTTSYTVTGVDGNGCIGTSLVPVSVLSTPVINSVTATPSSVCSGGSSQLQVNANPPNVNEYVFTAGTGTTLDPMTGSTTVITTSNDDTPTAAAAGIGFAFPFNGATYTQYSVSPDGWLSLGGAVATSSFTNQVTLASNTPKIYPLWDDLATGTTGNVKVLVTGTSPNQIFKVEWNVTVPRNTTGPANSTFQAWLYESTGVVEFRYGTIGVATGTMSAGLTGSATNFNSITYSSNTASSVTPNDNNTVVPPVGTIYTFTPPVFTYSWTPATFLNSTTIANPLASGITATTTYNVTASNGACPSAASPVTITSGSALTSSASITPSNTVCAGTAITISATGIGGGAPYTYAWTGPNGFTSTSASNPIASAALTDAGLYSVTVTDNCGATSVSTVTLTVNTLPVVTATPATALYCAPGTGVNLTASGANTYTWSPAAGLSATTGATVTATPSTNTTYTVIGTDGNGCTASTTATVNSALAITSVTANATPTATCNGNSTLTATAVLAPSTYCASTHTSGCSGDNMSNVSLGSISNATGTGCGGASHYTYFAPSATTTTTLSTSGGPYSLSVTFGTDGNQYFGAWIDYNQNGTLEASEFLGASANAGASGTIAVSFSVPIGASNGVTLMRIVGGNDATVLATQACGASSSPWGETQDYSVTISGGVDPYTITWSPATYLSSTSGPSVSASGIAANITYTATATTAAGCTNSANASVTLLAPSSSSTTASACGSYTWAQNSTTYTTSGAYTAIVPNAVGCDSTITLNLTINQPSTSSLTVAACGSYTWAQNATTYTTSGAYPVTLAGANAVGCDSTITLNLTINQPTTSSLTVAACGSYTWAENATTYTTSGAYPVTLAGANANGCDSTVTLNLTINQPTTSTVTATACGSYTWAENTTTYTTSGTYPVTLAGANANGCDSTITLNLTINQPSSSSMTAAACGSYTWAENTTTYTTSGAYSVVLAGANAVGCDSTVTLNLTINQPSSSSMTAAACGSYTWAENTTTYTTSGAYSVVLAGANAAGCDSTVTLNLTINQATSSSMSVSACDSYTWAENGTTYTTSGAYSVTLPGANANGCDSTVTLNLTIGALVATATDNGDATITASTGTTYQWIDCSDNSAIAGETLQVFTATANGDYAVVVTSGSCSDTSACVNIDYIGLTELSESGIRVSPNPTNGDVFITMTSATEATIEVVDAKGKLLNTVKVVNGEKVSLANYETGVYFLRIKTDNGSAIERIVKN